MSPIYLFIRLVNYYLNNTLTYLYAECVELCSRNWIVVSCSYFLLDVFSMWFLVYFYIVVMLHWIWVRWLCYLLNVSYHVFTCMCVPLFAYLLVIMFDYCFMNKPDLTCFVKGWSCGTCFPCKNTWKGNWFYLLL